MASLEEKRRLDDRTRFEFLGEKQPVIGNQNRLSASIFVDHFQQLVVHCLPLFGRPGTNGVGSTVREVIAHERSGDGSERLLRRSNLRENIRAISIVFDHALNSANLTFNSAEPAQVGSLDLGIDTDRFTSWCIRLARAGVFADGFEVIFLRGHIFLVKILVRAVASCW
jgi:hypothetical protein